MSGPRFGGWGVIRDWGRIGRGGTVRALPSPTEAQARAARERQQRAKERRGLPLMDKSGRKPHRGPCGRYGPRPAFPGAPRLSDLYVTYLNMTAHERVALYQTMPSRSPEEQRLFYRASAERAGRRMYYNRPDKVDAVMRKFNSDWERETTAHKQLA